MTSRAHRLPSPARLGLAALLTAALTACGAASTVSGPSGPASATGTAPTLAPATSAGASGPSTTPGSPTPIDPTPAPSANPVVATVTPLPGLAASKSIGKAGGSVVATGPDGTRYELVVPVGALVETLDITLSPASLGGLPAGTETAFAAELTPVGLYFRTTAWLLVSPAGGSAGGSGQATLGVMVDDNEAWLTRIGFDGSRYVLAVPHFSGVGGVRLPGPSGWLPTVPSTPGRSQAITGALDRGQPASVPPSRDWSAPGHDWGGAAAPGDSSATDAAPADGLGGAPDAATAPGDAVRDAIEAQAIADLTGDPDDQAAADAAIERARQQLGDEIDQLARGCIRDGRLSDAPELLRRQALGFALGLGDQPDEAAYQADLLNACLRFELDVKGSASIDMGAGTFVIGDTMAATVPLTWSGGAGHEGSVAVTLAQEGYDRGAELMEILGQGVGKATGISIPNDPTKNDYYQCTVTPATVTLQVVTEHLLAETGPALVMALDPGTTRVACNEIDPFDSPPFLTDLEFAHEVGIKEAKPGTGYLVGKWTMVREGATYATWHVSKKRSEEGTVVKMAWDLVLRHAPGEMPVRP